MQPTPRTVFDLTLKDVSNGALLAVMANDELTRRLSWLCPDFDRTFINFDMFERKYYMATFVNVTLSREQIEDLKVWLNQADADLDFYEALIAKEGYRISVKWNPKTESFVYSVMLRDMKYGSDGEILARHSGELWKARAEALWIHFELTKGDWSSLVDLNDADW